MDTCGRSSPTSPSTAKESAFPLCYVGGEVTGRVYLSCVVRQPLLAHCCLYIKSWLSYIPIVCVFMCVFRRTNMCAFLQYVRTTCVRMCTTGLESMFPQPCSHQRGF